jgi:AcrR family transcriptional regulator
MSSVPQSPSSPTTRRTHERLVDATRAEIAAAGSFTAERVAARAGSSPATFYSYFPSKADALAAAFESVMADLVQLCERELSIERLLDAGLAERCAGIVEATADFFGEHENLFRCALAALPESRRLRGIYREHEAEAFDVHLRFVERAQRAGQIGAGEPGAVAQCLLVQLQGLNNPRVVHGSPGDALRKQLARTLAATLASPASASADGDDGQQ